MPRLALQLHPDKCKAPGAAAAFAAVRAAASQLLQPSPACSDRDSSWWHAFAAPQPGSQQQKEHQQPASAWSAPRGVASTSSWQRGTTWHQPSLHTGSASPAKLCGPRQLITLVSDEDSPPGVCPGRHVPAGRMMQGNLDAWLRPSQAGNQSQATDADRRDDDSSRSEASSCSEGMAPGNDEVVPSESHSRPRNAGQQVLHQQRRTAALRTAQVLQRKKRLRLTIARMHKRGGHRQRAN